MAVRRYQDLVVWQLADELKRQVYELLENSPASRDFNFCDQIKSSASSAPANIAEGFSYYRHPEFARHLRVARSEIAETRNHLDDGVDRGYWRFERVVRLHKLAARAKAAATSLLRYLTTSQAPSMWPGERTRR